MKTLVERESEALAMAMRNRRIHGDRPQTHSLTLQQICDSGLAQDHAAADELIYQAEGRFELINDPPQWKRAQFESQTHTLQKVLIDGLHCLPGQQDLF